MANQVSVAAKAKVAELLTPRELEVLVLLVEGNRSKEIGCSLGIAEATVNKHTESLMCKLSARSRAEAVAKFFGQ
jgi:DNA-binding NarL/FixJ family response regulator